MLPLKEYTPPSVYGALPDSTKSQVVVNNAGITRDTLAMRMKPDMWQSVSCVYRHRLLRQWSISCFLLVTYRMMMFL